MDINEKSIGVFDSGMGGLTVVKRISELMPKENIVFLGDTANVPYGTKSPDEIITLAKQNMDFLLRYDVKAVVIACNTADSNAGKIIRNTYSLPIFGVIEPASIQAAKITQNKKIGVIATNATVSNGAYERAIKTIDPEIEVYSVPCPLLVPLAESGRYNKGDAETEQVVADYLKPLIEEKIDTLILGCTHYPLFNEIISDIIPNVQIVSSSDTAVLALEKKLNEEGFYNNSNDNPDKKYFVTKNSKQFEEKAKIFMGDISITEEQK